MKAQDNLTPIPSAGDLGRKLGSHPSGRQKRIEVLLVDDDPLFRRLVSGALDPDYFTVAAFESLPDVGSISQVGAFDIAVIDYYLPSVNGVEIAEYVDAFFKAMPVILVSGGRPGGDAEKLWPSCIKRYVEKSAGVGEVINAIIEIVIDERMA